MVKKKNHPTVKSKLHPRNKNRERYDFKQLIAVCPELNEFVRENPYGDESIDFSDAKAVKILNTAILKNNYGLRYWNIPANYLCPPIPGRADYIHYAADILSNCNADIIPTGSAINCLDVGVGANCIYPIIGSMEYEWNFVGADIEPTAIKSATRIVNQNPALTERVTLRLQANPKNIFTGIVQPNERFDLTFCNPPFHESVAEAQVGTLRKLSKLNAKKAKSPKLNFGGQSNELWCEGGEVAFLKTMIQESKQFAKTCFWLTSLVSKSERLPLIYKFLKQVDATEVQTISMGQGNKVSRIIAWTFLSKEEQRKWTLKWG